MTTAEFVRELYDSTSTSPDGITVDQAAEDIYNFINDGWTLPDDITPEEYAAEWNHCCAVDLADRLNLNGWHEDICEKLADLAGLLAEYREASGDECNDIVYQAAEKLGVTLD
jgi:hypothetical protein